jgi:hypothetical protein
MKRTGRLFLYGLLCAFAHSSLWAQAVKTTLAQREQGWTLLRNGAPYYIKGVGGEGDMDKALAIGANSIRTWNTDNAERILDEAQRRGMTVMMGLWLQTERSGFDYNDAAAVQRQIEVAKAQIDKYKNHPALLAWVIGNELDLKSRNPRVWDSVEVLAKYIHATDPDHPTLTVTAGLHKESVRLIKARAPSVDILGINTYGEIGKTRHLLDAYGWHGPYVITEWGMDGYWEAPLTGWNAAIEQSSSEKRRAIQWRYAHDIFANRDRCLGSYAFLWGWKQEYTSTWFGLFSKEGAPTEPIDGLEWAFTGKYPDDPAPTLLSLRLDAKVAKNSIRLLPGHRYDAEVIARSVDNQGKTQAAAVELAYSWILLQESGDKKIGGDSEREAAEVAGLIKDPSRSKIILEAPRNPGAYRLFVTVRHGGKVAYANVPFIVDQAIGESRSGK